VPRAQDAVFKDDELDQMLAPVAPYPDSLLSNLLMASTGPGSRRCIRRSPSRRGWP
jgi:hypothetical protein